MNREEREGYEQGETGHYYFRVFRAFRGNNYCGRSVLESLTANNGNGTNQTINTYAVFARFAVKIITDTPFFGGKGRTLSSWKTY